MYIYICHSAFLSLFYSVYLFILVLHAHRFMMLSMESHHTCRYDYVEVRDGDSLNSRVIGRYCGNNRPAPIQSSGNSLHILFVSDGYKNFDGFFATFQESSGTLNISWWYLSFTDTTERHLNVRRKSLTHIMTPESHTHLMLLHQGPLAGCWSL